MESIGDIRIDLDVPATMRDGTVLRADIYRPGAGSGWPVLLHRTPYGKRRPQVNLILDTLAAVSRGYIVIHQDTRGRFQSGGDWRPWMSESQDGYDTVRWAAGVPGSNGRVGMFGQSYTGNTQWNAAIAAPDELQAIAPGVTWSDPNDGLFERGGAVELGLDVPWSLDTGAENIRRLAGDAASLLKTLVEDYDDLAWRTYWELPSGHPPAIERSGVPDIGIRGALLDPLSAGHCRVTGRHEEVVAPAFNIGGWYDIFLQGTLDNHIGITALGRTSRLVVGPWTHGSINGMSGGQVGDRNFGLAANSTSLNLETSLNDMQLRWFDHWLKDRDSGLLDEPPVNIFVMGINRWRDEAAWPLARAQDTALHLRSDGGLSWAPPEPEEAADTYHYDPANPVITRGGPLVMSPEFPAGAFDQRAAESRPDVLVYTTEALTDDVEVTGRVRVILHATTDAPSTDWVARLCDVDKVGVSWNVTDGVLRAKTSPSEIGEHAIDLWSTSIVFRAGHRIRVHITSSNFPRWDRNLNTGESPLTGTTMRPATQMVFHDVTRPSRIILPIVRS